MYCLSKLIIRLTQMFSQYHYYLGSFLAWITFHVPLFMINKVKLTILRQFLGLYCLSKLIIRLTHDVFSISLLFRIVSSLNHIHVPLFMINKVKLTILRQFLGLYSPSKLILRLTHDVFSISLLFRIVYILNKFHVPLFMINKVNVQLLRQFLGLHCLSKLIIR